MVQGSGQADGVRGRRGGMRGSRLGLFLPFIGLAAVAVLWSAGWLYLRDRAGREIDAWLAREAAAGRSWTCADRSLTGYPFRLELRCASVALARADGGFTLGPFTALVQVYQPRHALFEAVGPFKTRQGDLAGEATWTRLRGSFHGAADGFVRASLAVDAPRVTVAGPDLDRPVAVSGEHLELHARPTPARFDADGAVDVSLRFAKARSPQADALIGNADPADIALDATLTKAVVLRTGTLARELEIWREAEGKLELTGLGIAKGDRRLQAKGTLGLDEGHRVAGQLDLRAAGLEALVGGLVGQRYGADRGALVGALVGGLLGSVRAPGAEGAPAAGETPLKSLPPLRLGDGRIMLGPFTIPNVRLAPLY
jgi:hypothetical protein